MLALAAAATAEADAPSIASAGEIGVMLLLASMVLS
jgi:hypothetical protein